MSASILRSLYPVTAGRLSLVALGILRAWLLKQPISVQRFPFVRDLGKLRHVHGTKSFEKGWSAIAAVSLLLNPSKSQRKSWRGLQVVDKLVGVSFAAGYTLLHKSTFILPSPIEQRTEKTLWKEGEGTFPLLEVKSFLRQERFGNARDAHPGCNYLDVMYAYALLDESYTRSAKVHSVNKELPQQELNLALLRYAELS